MKRALVTIFAAVAITFGVSSFAARGNHLLDQQMDPNAGNSNAPATSAGGVVPAGEMNTVPADAQSVTGEVVMATPSEITLRTSSGLQRFKLTPQTEQSSGYAEGEWVTVYYTPEQGTVKITTADATVQQQASPQPETTASTASGDDPAQATQPSMNDSDQAGDQASSQAPPQPTEPAETQATSPSNEPAAAAAPATTTSATTQTKKLPKTASDLPLLGLIGVLATAGGLTLRFALRG